MAKSKTLGVRKNENVDVLCYRFAALPTNEQIIQLNKTIGCCRYLWNRMLGDHNTLYQETMIQTIHLINVTKKKKKILVTANIEFDTLQTEEDVQNAFEEVLPKALKVTQKKPNQTAANFLQTAMAMVNERYKDIVYLSVNEDRRKGNPKTAINFNFKIH